MSIQIIPKSQQAKGQFNGGAILENKPIGFPQDGGSIRPYSNLFYWAHAWSDEGSLIGEHPHEGFEIMSFVLKGTIQHYDSNLKGWKNLKAGDAQIIRAGNGITHAEQIDADSHIFQIWVDPDLSKTLNKPASYNDYKDESFLREKENGVSIKYYAGEKGIMRMDTPGIAIKEYNFLAGSHLVNINADQIHSWYLVDGQVSINDQSLNVDDFILIRDENHIEFKVQSSARMFAISSPSVVGYKTYASMMRFR